MSIPCIFRRKKIFLCKNQNKKLKIIWTTQITLDIVKDEELDSIIVLDENNSEDSNFILEEELTRNNKNAAKTQIGIETANGAKLNAIAIAIVPKPT